MDALKIFYPGKELRRIRQAHGKGEIIKEEGDSRLIRFELRRPTYSFRVMVQVRQGKVVDFFTQLPSYLIHDSFHRALITRWGKQDRYFHLESSALYMWNRGGNRLIYRASCTITCFPVYLSGRPAKKTETTPFIEQIMLLSQ